jgi:hypothetical protein
VIGSTMGTRDELEPGGKIIVSGATTGSSGLPRWKIIPLIELEPPSTLPRAW